MSTVKSSMFVFITILALVTSVQFVESQRTPDHGNGTDDGFRQRNKREEAVLNPSAEYDEARLFKEFPTLVVVYMCTTFLCEGILISERFVIFPAYCLGWNYKDMIESRCATVSFLTKENFPIYQTNYRQFFNASVNEQLYTVSSVIKHPKFDDELFARPYDIALLKLQTPISTVAPSCLWLEHNLLPSKAMLPQLRYLQQKERLFKWQLNTVNNFDCKRYMDPVTYSYANIAIQDFHLCTVVEENFFSGPSSIKSYTGPIYTDLIYDGSIAPFVIGFRSMRYKGVYDVSVFVKVSHYVDWIKESIQSLGEQVPSSLLDPLTCAREYLNNRRKINGSPPVVKNETLEFIVRIQKKPETNQISNCVGVLFKEDMVVTLAECASDLIALASRVVMFDSSTITIHNVYIHPNYTEDSLYYNIALLKLAEKSSITPTILSYDSVRRNQTAILYGKQRIDAERKEGAKKPNGEEGEDGEESEEEEDGEESEEGKEAGKMLSDFNYLPVKAQGLTMRLIFECKPSEEHRSRLAQGLHYEHVCLQSDQQLVAGSCEADPGSPVVMLDTQQQDRNTNAVKSRGLYMAGRNCGFGEPAIVVLFVAHKDWIESVNYYAQLSKPNTVVLVIPNLEFNDECAYPEGTRGTCVAHSSCPNINKRVEDQLPIFFCTKKSIICCPQYTRESEITYAFNRNLEN